MHFNKIVTIAGIKMQPMTKHGALPCCNNSNSNKLNTSQQEGDANGSNHPKDKHHCTSALEIICIQMHQHAKLTL
jgi:hypothetical protein